MKIRRIAVLCMAVVSAVPMFSQENLAEAFKTLAKRADLIKAESHTKDIDKVTGEMNSVTDVYNLSLGKEDTYLIDYFKREFAKDRDKAAKIFSRSGTCTLNSQPSIVSVGSGDMKINIGSSDPESSYMVMVFQDVKDTVRNCRYVYAMEWKETEKGGAELSLISDHGIKPESKQTSHTAFKGNPEWDTHWIYIFNMYLKNMKRVLPRINKGELTVYPTKIYQSCLECPVKDAEIRKSCAEELRAVADKLTSPDAKMEKSILLRAADMLER